MPMFAATWTGGVPSFSRAWWMGAGRCAGSAPGGAAVQMTSSADPTQADYRNSVKLSVVRSLFVGARYPVCSCRAGKLSVSSTGSPAGGVRRRSRPGCDAGDRCPIRPGARPGRCW